MRLIFWLFVIVAGTFALLLGMYVRYWFEDTWPETILFFGHRLSLLLLIAGGLTLSASASFAAIWTVGRRRELRRAPGLNRPDPGRSAVG